MRRAGLSALLLKNGDTRDTLFIVSSLKKVKHFFGFFLELTFCVNLQILVFVFSGQTDGVNAMSFRNSPCICGSGKKQKKCCSATKESDFESSIVNAVKQAENMPCFFCNKEPVVAGVFYPTDEVSKKMGAPDGKHRIIVYSLCKDCVNIPDVQKKIEEIVINQNQNMKIAQSD